MKRLNLILIGLIISSCSTSKLPTLDIPAQFNSATQLNQNIESLPYLAWWQQLHDPQLNHLIESGLIQNNDIQIAYANLEQARGQLRQVQLSWIPFINLYAGFTQNPAFGNIGIFYGMWPQYTLNLMQLPTLQKQAEYNLALNQAKISALRLTLIGQISSSYLTYLAQQQQLILLTNLQNDLVLLAKIQRQALAGGISSAQSVDLLMAQEQQIVAQQQIVKNNLVASQNALRYLINANPGKINTSSNFAQLNESMIKPGNLPATVLANRPDLLIAEMQVKIANEGINVAISNLFPAIQLDRFMAMQSTEGTLANPTTPLAMSEGYLNWEITPSVFGQIEANNGSYKAASYNYIKTVRQILRDVDNDFAANNYLALKLSAERSSYQNAKHEFNLQQGLYNDGIIPYAQLINSRLLLDNLALSINQSKLQYLLSQVLLYQDLAGGYSYKSSTDANSTASANKVN